MKVVNILVASMISANAMAALPIYPAEVLGRDLAQPGLGFFGHVGISGGQLPSEETYVVMEVLNNNGGEGRVVQWNYITDFKSRSKYWGSRWGVSKSDQDALNILAGAYSQWYFRHDYTITSSYRAADKDHKGMFRCDTFVIWTLINGGHREFASTRAMPGAVFNAFPKMNYDAFLPNYLVDESVQAQTPLLTDQELDLISLSKKKINKLLNIDIVNIIDKAKDNFSNNYLEKIKELAKDKSIDKEKRKIFIEKISSIKDAKAINNFIKLYKDETDKDLKNKIINSSLFYYQSYLDKAKDSSEKSSLLAFYKSLLPEINKFNGYDILRGYIDLANDEDIIDNYNKTSALFNKIDKNSKLDLMITILQKSSWLKQEMFPKIIDYLRKENSLELDAVFFGRLALDFSYFADVSYLIRPYMLERKEEYSQLTYNTDPMQDIAKYSYDNLLKLI